jgi:hypothetical protein
LLLDWNGFMHRIVPAFLSFIVTFPLSAQTLWQIDSAGHEPRTVALLKMGAGFAFTANEPSLEIPAGELVSLRQAALPRPGSPGEPMLMLHNGDRWPGSLAGGKGLALEWNLALGGGKQVKLPVALPAVKAIWFTPPPDADDDAASFRWFDPARKQDGLLLRNGDVLKGTLTETAADGQSLRFQSAGEAEAKVFLIEQLSAVAFDPSLGRARVPKGLYAKAVLQNGARLTVVSITSDGKDWQGKAATGGEFVLPLAEVASLDVMQGKAAYLADLAPKAAKVEPFNMLAWNWQANRSVKGKPLRLTTPLGEECYDRGLGTHPKTTLEFDLAGKYRRFEAVVGLDARTGKKGRAAVSVSVDGKPQAVAGLADLKAGLAVPVRIDVAKARTLVLVIDFGPGGDVQDDVNWGDARLVE